MIHFSNLKQLCLTLVCMLITVFATAAVSEAADGVKIVVSGKVVDEHANPVPGAVLVNIGISSHNAITDVEGNYSIEVPEGATVSVRCIGYAAYEFTATKSVMNITLKSEALDLEETVVVGYGVQKKVNLTAAVSVIGNDEISTTTGTGIVTKLQGKVAGLNIRQMSAEPGAYNNSVNIRNFGTPIFIIDGIQRTNSDFNRLNSEDIESISILKDAAAAIYGLNASNGVVIVTTKQGSDGKTRFKFSTNAGFSSPTSLVEMTDAYGYYTLQNYSMVNYGGEPVISQEELEKYRLGLRGYETTDFKSLVLRDNAIRKEYNFSADGGSDKMTFYINANYIDDGGLLKTGDINYNKLALRSNLKAKLTDEVTATVNVSAYRDKKTQPVGGFYSVWRATVSTIPYRRPYANDNPDYLQNLSDGDTRNPLALASSDISGYSDTEINSYQITTELAYAPSWLKGLEFKGRVAYDQRFVENKSLNKEYYVYDYDPETDSYKKSAINSPSRIGDKFDRTRYVTTQAQATYKNTFADRHNVTATAVFETRAYDYSYLQTSKYYDYMGRYLLEVSARYDGSNRYHKDVRWGFFPVVSAGWRISEEEWMKNRTAISKLKLRASYGVVGQDQGDAYQYISAYTLGSTKWTSFEDGKTTQGINTPALVNKDLTWTKNYIANIGFDLGLWEDRLTVTLDAFHRLRTGILATRSISLSNTFGATYPQENLNSTMTRGIELSVLHDNSIGDLRYSIGGNLTFSRNRNAYIESSQKTNAWSYYRNSTSYRYSDIIWGYNVLGQFQTQEEIDNAPFQNGSRGNDFVYPGDWNYEDVNPDGVIDTDDYRPIAYGQTPILNYGLTLSLNFTSAASDTEGNFYFFQKGSTQAFYRGTLVGDEISLKRLSEEAPDSQYQGAFNFAGGYLVSITGMPGTLHVRHVDAKRAKCWSGRGGDICYDEAFGTTEGVDRLAEALDVVISPIFQGITTLLENLSGAPGSDAGRTQGLRGKYLDNGKNLHTKIPLGL